VIITTLVLAGLGAALSSCANEKRDGPKELGIEERYRFLTSFKSAVDNGEQLQLAHLELKVVGTEADINRAAQSGDFDKLADMNRAYRMLREDPAFEAMARKD